MKVMLTGGTGFVGSYATEALLAAGHDVRLAVRSPDKAERVLARRGVTLDQVETVPGDIGDADAIGAAIDGCDAVVHAAASIGVTSGDPDAVIANNVNGARNVLGQAIEAGCDPIIHISTIGCFVPSPDPVVTPDSPMASPRNPYGRSKIAAEELARGYQVDDKPVTIIYPGGVHGPDQPSLDAALEGMVGAIEQAIPIPPTGGVGILNVRDLAEMIVRCVEPGHGPRRFMAGGRFVTWGQYADAIDALTGNRMRRFPSPGVVMKGLGSLLDLAKKVKPFDYPLARDAAEFMVHGAPTEDGPTLSALGMSYRPISETLEDTLRWLVSEGHLSAKAAGRMAQPV